MTVAAFGPAGPVNALAQSLYPVPIQSFLTGVRNKDGRARLDRVFSLRVRCEAATKDARVDGAKVPMSMLLRPVLLLFVGISATLAQMSIANAVE